MSACTTMRAVPVERPGGPDALQSRELPLAEPRGSWPPVRVMAFGPNRAEPFTRRGLSPTHQGGGPGKDVRAIRPDGADRVPDPVGGVTARDSLRLQAPGGRVCHPGVLPRSWIDPGFEPLEDILIDRVFWLDEVAAARHRMEANRAIGKVVDVVQHS